MSKETSQYWNSLDFIHDLLDQIPAAIFWKDTASVFLGCNKYFSDFAGLAEPSEIVGKMDYDLPWGKFQGNLYIQDDQEVMVSKKAKLSIEETQTLSNGEEMVLLTNKLPLFSKQGEVVGVLGIYHDITARKKMELALERAKNKAELANRVKIEFIANMSHDIRTPLSGVVGMSKMLEEHVIDLEQKQYARWINESGEQLLGLLNSILDVVSSDENVSERDLLEEYFDLHKCIYDIVQLERPTSILKGLDLRIEIEDRVPQYVFTDRTKLHRILLNLLGNAIKFTQSGHIAVQVGLLKRLSDRVILRFCVIDTGIGIPEELQQNVFDRFFRANPSYKGVYSGHGVGLHIVQSYVELLGGEIKLESQLGVGTTASFDLSFKVIQDNELNNEGKVLDKAMMNATSVDEVKNQDACKHPSKLLNRTVLSQGKLGSISRSPCLLLVEDNTIALRMLEVMVAQTGCRYVSAIDAEKALELYLSAPDDFDLIITDIGLPGISGYDLAKRIREQEHAFHKRDIPIVGLTAHAHVEAKNQCFDSGMNDFLVKPINVKVIQSILEQYIPGVIEASLPAKSHQGSLGVDLPDTVEQLFDLDRFPLLDIKVAIENIGTQSLLYEMLKLMAAQEIPKDEKEIVEAYANQDWDTIERLAHKMKGGALYCGTLKMQYACQYLERYRKAGHSQMLDKLYKQLLQVLQETKEAIAILTQQTA